MKLFWSPNTRAIRATWLLEEMGLDYERVTINLHDRDAPRDPEFLEASPMGKVPALVDGPVKIWDSGAIALYLSDQYPETGLGVPVGDPQRGDFLRWTLFTNAVVEPALGEKFSGREPTPLQSGYGSYDLMIETLSAGLSQGPWILGERFTAADTLIGTSLTFMRFVKLLPEDPNMMAYLARCEERPAYQRARAMEED